MKENNMRQKGEGGVGVRGNNGVGRGDVFLIEINPHIGFHGQIFRSPHDIVVVGVQTL